MRLLPQLAVAALFATSAFAWTGCSSGSSGKNDHAAPPNDVDFATDGSETVAAETDAQLITSSLVASSTSDSLSLASEPADALQTLGIGDGARAIYFPPGCLKVTDDAATKTATYEFSQCTGPSGLRDVTGVVSAHYEVVDKRLHLELSATKVAVNRATLDWTATANITSTGAGRSMSWKATLSGVSGGGRKLERTSDHVIAWQLGEPCFSLDGTSEGRVNERRIKTVIADFRRCRRSCPDDGGRITVTNVEKNESFELRYDGTNRATFVDPDGNTVAVPLLCTP